MFASSQESFIYLHHILKHVYVYLSHSLSAIIQFFYFPLKTEPYITKFSEIIKTKWSTSERENGEVYFFLVKERQKNTSLFFFFAIRARLL